MKKFGKEYSDDTLRKFEMIKNRAPGSQLISSGIISEPTTDSRRHDANTSLAGAH